MKVCMLMSNPFPPEEGIGNYVYNLSKVLVDKGHTVTIVTRGGFSEERFSSTNISVVKNRYIPLFPFHVGIHGIFTNRYFSEKHDFDIVHLHSPLPPFPKIKTPIVSTVHTSLVEDCKAIERFNFKSACTILATHFVSVPNLRTVIRGSRVVTVVSPSVKVELEKYYGAQNIDCMSNGVDERIFFRKSTNSRDENFILYVGRLSYRKGLFDLLIAQKEIHRKYGTKLVICGKGELEKDIRQLIASEGLNSSISLVGHVELSELVSLYQRASTFVFPSLYEGLPTVVLEAMACGAPVVVSNIPAHTSLIDDGDNGLLCEVNNPDDIVRKVGVILNDEKMALKLSDGAVETIRKRYTWEKIGSNFIELYKKVINGA